MDIVLRGIDVDGVIYVINFDLFDEVESYVYWIGWIVWVGKSGIVIFFCDFFEIK